MQSASAGSVHKHYDNILSLPLSGAEVKIDGDSDSEMRKVPEVSGKTSSSPAQTQETPTNSRKRGAAADKEHKRLKRLLRNRVSAQQARERKKAYVVELEAKARELELRNAELEERVNTLQKETHMLRQVVKSMKSNGSTATASLEQHQ